ncbi:MAG: aspartyl protease [Planctomycetes bacterium]|nr:aspartyl protease [Planctomycetota bacterium]
MLVKKNHDAVAGECVTFLLDSGAVYSVVQGEVLRRLCIRPYRTRTFHLADGHEIERKIGDAYFEYRGVGGAAPVIFGEPGDSNLLGTTTLEALELVLDPFKRELRPMTLSLMGMPMGCR